MADSRRYLPNQELDLEQILQEAKNRWLRPIEIFEILRNYQKFNLTPDPPVRPPAGSLFLFDRKALRYFRKDGHRWRKKKDGKTVREAHEKLKAGSVDVLHCYYAHGEDNESFQRRSYWMLDRQLEHIVLVHYREVKEGYKSGISRLANSEPVIDNGSHQVSSAPSSAIANPAVCIYASSPTTSHWTGQTLSSEFDQGDSGDDRGTYSLNQPIYGSSSYTSSLRAHEAAGFSELLRTPLDSDFAGSNFSHETSSSFWPQIHSSSKDVNTTFNKNVYFGQLTGADAITRKLVDAQLDAVRTVQDVLACGNGPTPDKDTKALTAAPQGVAEVPREHDFNILNPKFQSHSDCNQPPASDFQVENTHKESGNNHVESVELKKLDSFGRWMDKEIGVDCDDSLMASDSGNYWNTLDTQNDDKEVSSLSRQMQLDMDSLGPSLSQEQLFSIWDFSPDWAYTGVETKVLITGRFLGNTKHSVATKWCCMFGEIEVAVEVLTNNTFRCHAPMHASGRVPFYITCSNRLACSEVREFEYRAKLPQDAFTLAVRTAPEDELLFQIRLAKLLYLDLERKWLDCSREDCDKCKLKKCILATKTDKKDDWQRLEAASAVVEANKRNPRDVLIENLLKDRLSEWLICKLHEGGKGPNIWAEGGQGVIHMTAALGYEWAMGPIVAAGVSPNFRDAHGRTALHWASLFGREEVVLALVRLGADSGAVDDPKPSFPGGQTAADLASSRGHKGIAGYLAEAHLTSHLSSLTINQNLVDNVAATTAEKNVTETAVQALVPSDDKVDEQLSLKGSLVAVQKSIRAAALIQAAFRAHSFRYRQLTKSSNEISEVSLDLVALGSLNKVHKMCHFSDYLHSAAVKIQQKYRGWKGRKDFLKIRNRIVKIQAHVRGHQVRKQYKKVVWSVSIVEKVILRWRRRRSGLRGFRVEKATGNLLHETENDEYEYLRIGRKQKSAGVENALARVKSMARHPEARDQYRRLITKFEKFKMGDGGASASQQADGTKCDTAVQDLHSFTAD